MESRRERKKRATRTRLLDSAKALFARHGIHGTKVQAITERADVGKGVFYNYFASKNYLVAELLAEAVSVLDRDYLARLEQTRPLRERVAGIIELHEAFFREHLLFAVLFHQARGLLQGPKGRPDGERIERVFRDYLTCVGQVIPHASERQAWAAEDLLDAAAAITGTVSGNRTLRVAAALPGDEGMASQMILEGLPAVLERRRLDA